MKYILLIVTTILGMSCTSNAPENERLSYDQKSLNATKVFTKGDCEYLIYTFGNGGWMTHKGNCSNPIHVYNKPVNKEEQIKEIEKKIKHFYKLFKETEQDSL